MRKFTSVCLCMASMVVVTGCSTANNAADANQEQTSRFISWSPDTVKADAERMLSFFSEKSVASSPEKKFADMFWKSEDGDGVRVGRDFEDFDDVEKGIARGYINDLGFADYVMIGGESVEDQIDICHKLVEVKNDIFADRRHFIIDKDSMSVDDTGVVKIKKITVKYDDDVSSTSDGQTFSIEMVKDSIDDRWKLTVDSVDALVDL